MGVVFEYFYQEKVKRRAAISRAVRRFYIRQFVSEWGRGDLGCGFDGAFGDAGSHARDSAGREGCKKRKKGGDFT